MPKGYGRKKYSIPRILCTQMALPMHEGLGPLIDPVSTSFPKLLQCLEAETVAFSAGDYHLW